MSVTTAAGLMYPYPASMYAPWPAVPVFSSCYVPAVPSHCSPNRLAASALLTLGETPTVHPTPKPVRRSSGFSFASLPSDIARETEAKEAQTRRFSVSPIPVSSPYPVSPSYGSPSPPLPYSVELLSGVPGVQFPVDKTRTWTSSPIPDSDRSRSPVESTPEEAQVKFPCGQCGKVYSRRSTLNAHLRTHDGQKPFECKDCGKTFTQAANLTAHQRIHTGDRPYKCPICNRGFSQSSSVTTHLRTHSGEKPYRCTICPRAFADASTLTKHIRTHTNEKPYQCSSCGLSFTQSGNLKRHMKVHDKRNVAS
ncbi:uncharacterized protein LOC144882790 [Branchiostoma floridae x Branchiostoma japonicum]